MRLSISARLNGWQRLWVVLAVLWTIVWGAMAWGRWPEGPRTYVNPTTGEPLPPIYLDPVTRTPLPGADTDPLRPVSYEAVLAMLGRTKGVPSPTPPAEVLYDIDGFPLYTNDLDINGNPIYAAMPVVNVPDVGSVWFPSTMNPDKIKSICESLTRRFSQQADRRRAELQATRTKWAWLAVGFWLLPPLALYGVGWSVGWVYRGFSAKSPPPVS